MPFNEDGSRKSVMYKKSGFKMKGSAFYGKGNQSPAPQAVIGEVPEDVPPVRPEPTSDNPGGDMPYSPSDSPTKQHSYKNMQGYAPKSDYDSYAAQKNAYLGMNVPSSPAKKTKRHYDSYDAAKAANAPLKKTKRHYDSYNAAKAANAPLKKTKRHYDSYNAAKAANAPLKKVKRHYDSYNAAKAANAPLKQNDDLTGFEYTGPSKTVGKPTKSSSKPAAKVANAPLKQGDWQTGRVYDHPGRRAHVKPTVWTMDD